MNTARKFLELAADFLIFVVACFFILSGMSQVSAMQEALHRGLADKGMSQLVEYPVSCSTGEELIALFCYPEGIDKAVIDGNVFEGNLQSCMGHITASVTYSVNRIVEEDGTVCLEVSKLVP